MNRQKRLGELLLDAGTITAVQLDAALAYQRKSGGKLGQALVRLRIATEPQVVEALSRRLGYTAVDLTRLQASPAVQDALQLVPRELAERHLLLPIASDAASITVVMSDPTNVLVVDEISFRTGRRVKVVIAGDSSIAMAIRRLYRSPEDRLRGVAPAVTPQPPTQATAAPKVHADRPSVLPLDRACGGSGSTPDPVQMIAALMRVLISSGLVTELELVRELGTVMRADSAGSGILTRDGSDQFRSVG